MGLFRRFWSGEEGRKGNTAIVFALSLIPIIGATGAALDYSMANSSRTSMQKALDATALALAKLMPLSQASLGNVKVAVSQSDLQITTPAIGRLVLNVSGQYQPVVAGVIGINNFPVGAQAEVTWGIKKLEIALALDNTGSMLSNNKMTELKTASHNLLNTLQQAARNPDDVKVAIVPFHVQVKVGTANVNATWIKWTDWDAENQTCTGSSWNRVCTPKNHNQWTGCIEDRDQSHDTLDTAPTNNTTRFPAIQCGWQLAEIMPLTNNWTNLHNRIDAMVPDGNTNVTIGLAWAWHLLTPTEPYTEALPNNTPDLSRFIILLTDGDNTQNRWSTSQNSIDNRTALACANVKAAGIKIYAIRVINGNATLLRNCASDPSMYFDVQSASDLNAVFNAIGGQLASLHLSQ
ncbi:MAG TPA: VWA domain-containing protein [Xanthobacteraceae bacterium]|nr:VWA domain-containing protein [Xanthobacteraceae bacterium]